MTRQYRTLATPRWTADIAGDFTPDQWDAFVSDWAGNPSALHTREQLLRVFPGVRVDVVGRAIYGIEVEQ